MLSHYLQYLRKLYRGDVYHISSVVPSYTSAQLSFIHIALFTIDINI